MYSLSFSIIMFSYNIIRVLSQVTLGTYHVSSKSFGYSQDAYDDPLIAVVTASYGSYDDPWDVFVKDTTEKVDYFFYTDAGFILENSTVDSFPHHLHDFEMQVPGAKNSINGIQEVMKTERGRTARKNMMASKYYKVMVMNFIYFYFY